MASETPSPSPLTPEDRERLEWLADRIAHDGVPANEEVLRRVLSEVDRLAARVSDLERASDSWRARAEKAETVLRALDGKAQEARRAWDAMDEAGDRLSTITGAGKAEAEQEYSDLFDEARAAIDALVPPVPEDKKESAP